MSADQVPPEPDVQDRAAGHDRNGWGPIPLPTGKKAQPPKGFTGAGNPAPTFADWYAVWDGNRDAWGNLGVRIPLNVVGVDVDAYGDKNGGHTWKLLGGPDWPDTIILSSRFKAGYDGASGIRFYRLPDGVTENQLWGAHDGIEILRHSHRYAVAPGSDHPEGGQYRAWDLRSRVFVDTLPNPSDLPELTLEQARLLTTDGAPWSTGPTSDKPRPTDPNPMCAYTSRLLNRALTDLTTADSRYQTMSDAVWALISGEDEGHHLGQSLNILKLAYFQATAADRKKSNAENPMSEFDRNVDGARAKVDANPTWEGFKGCCASDDGTRGTSETPFTPPDEAPEQPDDDAEPSPYDKAVRRRYLDLRINEDATELLHAHRAGQAKPLTALPLGEFLTTDYPEQQYRVAGLWPAEGRVLLPAAAKTGKTTLVACNLIPSLVNGSPFLGHDHEVHAAAGTIVYLNLEVGERTMQRWMTDAGMTGNDRVHVANLRGSATALTLGSAKGRARVAEWLRDLGAEIVILDPLAPVLAALGMDENSNSDIARFFGYWADTLHEAGVSDDLIVHHTGHAGQRSRGASRLLDEPDAIWTLTKDDQADKPEDELDAVFGMPLVRYLQATGRDVDLPAQALDYNHTTRLLTLTGKGKHEVRKEQSDMANEEKVRRLLAGGRQATQTDIMAVVTGNNQKKKAVFEEMLVRGVLRATGNVTGVRKAPLYEWVEQP